MKWQVPSPECFYEFFFRKGEVHIRAGKAFRGDSPRGSTNKSIDFHPSSGSQAVYFFSAFGAPRLWPIHHHCMIDVPDGPSSRPSEMESVQFPQQLENKQRPSH